MSLMIWISEKLFFVKYFLEIFFWENFGFEMQDEV